MKSSTVGILVTAAVVGGFAAGYGVPRKPSTALVPSTTAGGAPAQWARASKEIAYVLPNEGPYYDLKWAGSSAELTERGYLPRKYNATGYKNIKAQTDIMDNLIQKKVGGIILHAVDQKALIPSVEKAFEAGIPVIAENVEVASPKIAGSVQLNNWQNGYELAMALVEAIGGKGKIAALVGPPGLEASDEMWKGAKEYFRRWPQVRIVREEYLQVNAQDALTRTEAILTAHDDLVGIYAWFVQTAIGAVQAAKAKNYPPGRLKIVAKDFDSQGEALLREGYISGLLVGETVNMGRTSASLMDDVLNGRISEKKVVLTNTLVTSRTLDIFDRTGIRPPGAK